LDADNNQVRVRLDSIDTPEAKQAFGTTAKNSLASLVHERTVTIHQTGIDRYKRLLAFVTVNGNNANAELIRQGYAWHYIEYSKDTTLAVLCQFAG
jgi:micrococcal nuclease